MLELDIELDGENIANYRPGTTGGWTTWQTVSPATVWLPEGTHKLRFVWGSAANLKSITIEPYDCRDIDLNGKVDICDAVALENALISSSTANGLDVNCDGTIDSNDTADIRKYILEN